MNSIRANPAKRCALPEKNAMNRSAPRPLRPNEIRALALLLGAAIMLVPANFLARPVHAAPGRGAHRYDLLGHCLPLSGRPVGHRRDCLYCQYPGAIVQINRARLAPVRSAARPPRTSPVVDAMVCATRLYWTVVDA